MRITGLVQLKNMILWKMAICFFLICMHCVCIRFFMKFRQREKCKACATTFLPKCTNILNYLSLQIKWIFWNTLAHCTDALISQLSTVCRITLITVKHHYLLKFYTSREKHNSACIQSSLIHKACTPRYTVDLSCSVITNKYFQACTHYILVLKYYGATRVICS